MGLVRNVPEAIMAGWGCTTFVCMAIYCVHRETEDLRGSIAMHIVRPGSSLEHVVPALSVAHDTLNTWLENAGKEEQLSA